MSNLKIIRKHLFDAALIILFSLAFFLPVGISILKIKSLQDASILFDRNVAPESIVLAEAN